jgi:hypothetical protein
MRGRRRRTEGRRQRAEGRGHVSVTDQEHDRFGQVAREAEHDASLIHVVLAINNQFRTRVRQKFLQLKTHDIAVMLLAEGNIRKGKSVRIWTCVASSNSSAHTTGSDFVAQSERMIFPTSKVQEISPSLSSWPTFADITTNDFLFLLHGCKQKRAQSKLFHQTNLLRPCCAF